MGDEERQLAACAPMWSGLGQVGGLRRGAGGPARPSASRQRQEPVDELHQERVADVRRHGGDLARIPLRKKPAAQPPHIGDALVVQFVDRLLALARR